MFCSVHPQECGPNEVVVPSVSATDELMVQLSEINAAFNASIRAITDLQYYGMSELWAYPTNAGDCEDFVLAKRRALAEAGWPLSTLLITLVRQRSGDGHAVLMVRTDRGDYVLDNIEPDVHLWNELPYTYVKRQSQENAGLWVSLTDDRDITIVAAASH